MHDVLSWPSAAGIEKYDCEGRLITAEYENFYFLTSCEQLLYTYLTTTYSPVYGVCCGVLYSRKLLREKTFTNFTIL